MDEPLKSLDLQTTSRGVVFNVRAQPGARRNAIVGVHAAALKVAVTAAADKGKANEAIVALLCDRLDLARSQVAVVAGAASRQKKLRIAGITAADLRRRIALCLAD
ncbi:MAG: DUF167 domain-containing protein [Pirellulales bacterium]